MNTELRYYWQLGAAMRRAQREYFELVKNGTPDEKRRAIAAAKKLETQFDRATTRLEALFDAVDAVGPQ